MSDIYSVKLDIIKNLLTPYTSGNSPEITQVNDNDLTINTAWNEYDFMGGQRWLRQMEFPLSFNTSTNFIVASKDPLKLGTQVWRFLWGIIITMREHGLDEVVAKIEE